jgi:small-conductance mechanosensitive channel
VAQTENNQSIIDRFAQKGISIPFPQREIRIIGKDK